MIKILLCVALMLLSFLRISNGTPALLLPLKYAFWRTHVKYDPYHADNLRNNIFQHNHVINNTYNNYRILYYVLSVNQACNLPSVVCVECQVTVQRHHEGICPGQGTFLIQSHFQILNNQCAGNWIPVTLPENAVCPGGYSFIFI